MGYRWDWGWCQRAAGPFLQLFFGHIWDLALADRTAAQKKAAMDSLFESVGKMISQALAESVADQDRAYNASIARLSVQSYKENASSIAVQKVVVRFENCKLTLVHMLNLYAQPSYMKHTVLSYGSSLALYVGLLREMMLADATCGYSKAEIIDFQNDVNEHLESTYYKVLSFLFLHCLWDSHCLFKNNLKTDYQTSINYPRLCILASYIFHFRHD
ncbi:hypothetical protein GOP47_0022266 [Adiantum capillus-veneris]|uniref:Uncharacterized protein n=1 Tax=Adiantum capillus-veneris TaxID=13818 RepID=A0A9D4UAP8_ADICA|nr:hypothetical protein GOP47_0022266 [Adiantum capillus-veneris]